MSGDVRGCPGTYPVHPPAPPWNPGAAKPPHPPLQVCGRPRESLGEARAQAHPSVAPNLQKDINNGPWKATNKLINVVTRSNVYKLVKPTIIEAGMKYALATGNWGAKTSRVRQGVAQVRTELLLTSYGRGS